MQRLQKDADDENELTVATIDWSAKLQDFCFKTSVNAMLSLKLFTADDCQTVCDSYRWYTAALPMHLRIFLVQWEKMKR